MRKWLTRKMTPGPIWPQLIEKALVLLFFATLFFMLLLPVNDPDFWWHLASGKWMWSNGTLLQTDPFTMELPFKTSSPSGTFILRQYWLSQLIFFGIYLVAGYSGVIFLGASVFTLMFYIMYRLLRQGGGNRLLCISVTFLAVMVILREFGYVGMRPQMWSSLGAVAVILLLEALRRSERWAYFLLPVLMVVWANLHGGFILGDAIITIYLVGAFISRTATKAGTVVGLLAIGMSGLNPNGFTAVVSAPFVGQLLGFLNLQSVASLKELTESVSETQSLFQHASLTGIARKLPFFTAIMLLSLLSCILNIKQLFRARPEFLLLYILVLLMGVRSIRFIIFFTAIASYISVINLQGIARSWRLSRFAVPRPLPAAAFAVVVITASSRFVLAGMETFPFSGRSPFANDYEKAADFIREKGLTGTMFNDYNAGGYLIWRISPEVKIFIDGRVLYGKAFEIFRYVADAPLTVVPGHGYFYSYALNDFKIDMVLVPGCDPVSGTLIRLVPALLSDPSWALVYGDGNSLLFLRNTPANREFIARHRQPDKVAYSTIFNQANGASRGDHAAMLPNWKLSMAVAYGGINEHAEALRWLAEYRTLRPEDQFAQELQKKLSAAAGGRSEGKQGSP